MKATVIPSPERLQETQLGSLGAPSRDLIYWYNVTNAYKRDNSYDRVVHETRQQTHHHDSHATSYTASPFVILSHTSTPLTSLRLDHRFGPTLTYPSTTRRPDDMAGIITLRLGWSPTMGEGASPLVTDGLGGRVVAVAATTC